MWEAFGFVLHLEFVMLSSCVFPSHCVVSDFQDQRKTHYRLNTLALTLSQIEDFGLQHSVKDQWPASSSCVSQNYCVDSDFLGQRMSHYRHHTAAFEVESFEKWLGRASFGHSQLSA